MSVELYRGAHQLEGKKRRFGDSVLHEISDAVEIDARIAELQRKFEVLDQSINEHEAFLKDDDSELDALAYTLSEIETAFEAVIVLLEDMPEELLLTRRECSQMAQRCFYRIHEMEPYFLNVVDVQFRKQIRDDREGGDEILYRSVFDVLSDDQSAVVQKLLHRTSPEHNDRTVILEEMTRCQVNEQRDAQKLPPHLIRYCADIYAEMQMVEFDYYTEGHQLDEIWMDTTGMEELPQRLAVLTEIVRVDLMRAARLFVIAGGAASEKISELRDRNQQLAREYVNLHLPALAFAYKQIDQYFDAMIQLMSVYYGFHGARSIEEV